jgi:hypothetical protein
MSCLAFAPLHHCTALLNLVISYARDQGCWLADNAHVGDGVQVQGIVGFQAFVYICHGVRLANQLANFLDDMEDGKLLWMPEDSQYAEDSQYNDED